MSDILPSAAPLIAILLFMLIPVWIPLVSMTIGALFDLVRPRSRTSAHVTVDARRARSTRQRQERRENAATAAGR